MGTAAVQRGRYRLQPTADDVNRRSAGDRKPRGRLERNLGAFVLRPGLSGPGAMPLADALDAVFADWDRQVAAGTIGTDIIAMYQHYLRGLHRVVSSRGIDQVCDLSVNVVLAWVLMPGPTGLPPSENTTRLRRSAVRSFFETAKALGITDANPGKVIEFPSRSDRYVHALTGAQVLHLQRLARTTLDDSRTPAGLAVVMSGGTTRELSHVIVDDVDLDNARVWVSGGGFKQRDRWIPLYDAWCVNAVTTRVNELREAHGDAAGAVWLVYKPHPSQPSPTRQDSAASGLITRFMQSARVHIPGVTRAESIREWLAQTVFEETGSIEAVALRLGMASLDAAALIVGHDWTTASSAAEPAPAHRRDSETT